MKFKPGEIPKGAKPFQKGQSGNPKGRPKKPDLVAEFIKQLGKETKVKGEVMSMFEAAVFQVVKQAAEGDLKAFELMMSRLYGKPAAAENEQSGKLTVTFEQDDSPAPEPENLDDEEA